MGPVVPPRAERSAIPTAKSTLDLAAPAMAIAGIRPLTVGLAANLAAQRPLPQRIQLPLDLMAVAALPSLVPPATPTVPSEAAAQLMVIAARQPITAVPDVRTDAMAGPVQHRTRLRHKQYRPPLLKSPSSAYQPLDPSMAHPLPMEPVAPQMAVLFAVTGHKEAAAQPMAGPCTGTPAIPAPGPKPADPNPNPGVLALAPQQAGVPAMHAGLMPNGKVVFLDKVEETTQIGKFREDENARHKGQYAYSVEYDPVTMGVPKRIGYNVRERRLFLKWQTS
ncbi:MAG: hypothetical protein Q9184_003784 [Pyrenodesmia sp. 2 TL-2023]